MTKEELEKEAREYADTKVDDRKGYNARWELVRNAYLAGAEPREKRIAQLEQQNVNLQKAIGWSNESENEKATKIVELELLIEKMKNCPNCDFFNYRFEACYYDKECKNKDHWKLRR